MNKKAEFETIFPQSLFTTFLSVNSQNVKYAVEWQLKVLAGDPSF